MNHFCSSSNQYLTMIISQYKMVKFSELVPELYKRGRINILVEDYWLHSLHSSLLELHMTQ